MKKVKLSKNVVNSDPDMSKLSMNSLVSWVPPFSRYRLPGDVYASTWHRRDNYLTTNLFTPMSYKELILDRGPVAYYSWNGSEWANEILSQEKPRQYPSYYWDPNTTQLLEFPANRFYSKGCPAGADIALPSQEEHLHCVREYSEERNVKVTSQQAEAIKRMWALSERYYYDTTDKVLRLFPEGRSYIKNSPMLGNRTQTSEVDCILLNHEMPTKDTAEQMRAQWEQDYTKSLEKPKVIFTYDPGDPKEGRPVKVGDKIECQGELCPVIELTDTDCRVKRQSGSCEGQIWSVKDGFRSVLPSMESEPVNIATLKEKVAQLTKQHDNQAANIRHYIDENRKLRDELRILKKPKRLFDLTLSPKQQARLDDLKQWYKDSADPEKLRGIKVGLVSGFPTAWHCVDGAFTVGASLWYWLPETGRDPVRSVVREVVESGGGFYARFSDGAMATFGSCYTQDPRETTHQCADGGFSVGSNLWVQDPNVPPFTDSFGKAHGASISKMVAWVEVNIFCDIVHFTDGSKMWANLCHTSSRW